MDDREGRVAQTRKAISTGINPRGLRETAWVKTVESGKLVFISVHFGIFNMRREFYE